MVVGISRNTFMRTVWHRWRSPCPDIKITRALQRLNAKDASQCTAVLDTDNICDAVRKVFEEEFKLNEHLNALNRLVRCYQGFKGDDLEKFHTVFDHAWPQTPEEATYLAEGLRDFTVINGISTADLYGATHFRTDYHYLL